MNLKVVTYIGWEFALSQNKTRREYLVDFVKTVPYEIAKIIKKEKQNWL